MIRMTIISYMPGKKSLYPPLFKDKAKHTVQVHQTQGHWILTALSSQHTDHQATKQYTFLCDLTGSADLSETDRFSIDDIFSHLVTSILGRRESKGLELETQLFTSCFSSIRQECKESLISEFLLLLVQRCGSTRDQVDNKV